MIEPQERGFAMWLTGLPASGKTTVAHEIRRLLAEHEIPALVLDSDELRGVLTPEPQYSAAERDWFYGVIVWLAGWLTNNNVNVVIAATANRRAYRDQARAQIARFAEVYVRCPREVCEQRDVKGTYAQARAGDAPTVPGVGEAYEPPLAPEAVIDTDRQTPVEAALSILEQTHRALGLPLISTGSVIEVDP